MSIDVVMEFLGPGDAKDWQLFERLVAALHGAAGEKVTTTWGDIIDGRQFDVTLRFKHGIHNYLTVIECKNSKSAIPVEKVEAFVTKSRGVLANKAVMVSSSGFQSGAIRVGKAHGIKLLTLAESFEHPQPFEVSRRVPGVSFFNVRVIRNDGAPDIEMEETSGKLEYHARIGVGHHAGNAAIEEEFLVRDAFFMLAKCQVSLARLERFRDELKIGSLETGRYKLVSMFNQNVATYARYAVFGFYSFVECFINSVGEDFVARNPNVSPDTSEMLRGKKDGRYLSVERKLEVFPGLIRPDGKRPIVLSDPKQRSEPYQSFAGHIKEVRDSSAHFAKNKTDIILPPQAWEKRAKEASVVCLSVARGFWSACYPNRLLPLYLGQLDDASHAQIAEQRVSAEMKEILAR